MDNTTPETDETAPYTLIDRAFDYVRDLGQPGRVRYALPVALLLTGLAVFFTVNLMGYQSRYGSPLSATVFLMVVAFLAVCGLAVTIFLGWSGLRHLLASAVRPPVERSLRGHHGE